MCVKSPRSCSHRGPKSSKYLFVIRDESLTGVKWALAPLDPWRAAHLRAPWLFCRWGWGGGGSQWLTRRLVSPWQLHSAPFYSRLF